MRVVPGQQRHIRGEMMLKKPAIMHGMPRTRPGSDLIPWDKKSRTPGGFTTCTETVTSGSGMRGLTQCLAEQIRWSSNRTCRNAANGLSHSGYAGAGAGNMLIRRRYRQRIARDWDHLIRAM